MSPPIIVPLLFVTFFLVAWSIGTYNKFIKYRNRIEESLQGIDVALKRRANLIPSLVKVVEKYSSHEDTIFQEKTRQLGMLSEPNRLEEEQQISRNIGGLLAIAEAYPDLKASTNFLDLQNNLDEIEQDVQQARNRYNGYIARFNTQVESFPASYIARKFHFTKQDYLVLELATQREMPNIFTPSDSGRTDKEV
ncbi:MAG: LemA family protein [Deltaproteobacteria bacterium]|nr:LemA family protein [Deltaproteobacteria bacterium]